MLLLLKDSLHIMHDRRQNKMQKMLYQKGKTVLEADHKKKQDHCRICRIHLVLCRVPRATGAWIAFWVLCRVCYSWNCLHDTIMSDDVFLVNQSSVIGCKINQKSFL